MNGEDLKFEHSPVLLDECIEGLNIRQGGTYVDGTAGGGGHSSAIAERLTDGKLIAIDRDESAIRAAGARLAPFGERVRLVRNNFSEISAVCKELGVSSLDGVLMDLGVSSHQLDTPERGFSYMADAELDMRMDRRGALTAYDVVNTYTQVELRRILFEYGEEKFAPKIAAAICAAREKKAIERTGELCDIIKSAMPAAAKNGGHHPAKRSFQAIRIEVNGELDAIEPAIRSAVELLSPGGRIAIITFHSLEDRIVKQTFADLASGCTCPREFPICVCGKTPKVRLVSKKPILPSEDELLRNPRARSAKLRVAEKL